MSIQLHERIGALGPGNALELLVLHGGLKNTATANELFLRSDEGRELIEPASLVNRREGNAQARSNPNCGGADELRSRRQVAGNRKGRAEDGAQYERDFPATANTIVDDHP